jgi:ribonuclease BN (tRNA processing enzyme)
MLAAPSYARAAEDCPALRWTTLGTAGGPVPTPERSEPANLLTAGDQHILVDTGDGTVNQLAKIGLEIGVVRTVFISHHHWDHTGGLAAVIGLRWMNNYPGLLTIYGPPGTREMVDAMVAAIAPQARIGFGLGQAPLPPAASVRVIELRGNETRQIGDLTVTTAANSHFDHNGPKQADPAQSLSYRFTLGSRSVTYTGDTGPSAAVTMLAQGSDLLVSEVIDLDRLLSEIRSQRADMPPEIAEGMRRHLSTHHITAADVGIMASAAKTRHLVLTHYAMPGPLATGEAALRAGVRAAYAGPLDLARDLSSFDVGCSRP